MNPTNSLVPSTTDNLIQQAQAQNEQNMVNPLNITPASGSTADQASQQSPQQSSVNPTNATHSSLLQRLLPTGAGIIGSIIGAALAPETGGLSLAIPALAAGAGSAGGKVAENATEGKNLGSGAIASGVEGAAGQGVASGAGALLGKAGGALTDIGGNMADKAAAKVAQVASDANAQSDTQAALDEANAIRNNYGGVKPGVQSANNLSDNLDLLKKFGVDHTDPNAMQAASKGGLFINDIDNAALASGNPIKTTDLLTSKNILDATPEEQQALASSGIITPEGAMPNTITPVQANKFAQDLNGQLRDLKATMDNAQANGRINDYTAAKQQYNILSKTYENAQKLASTPEVDATISARTISPEEKEGLVQQFGQAQADHIENAVNSAKTHQDLVNAKLPFAQMNTISKQALGDMQAQGTPRALARTKADIAPTSSQPNGNIMSGDNLVKAGSLLEGTVGGHPLALAAPLVMKAAENPAVVKGVGGILSSLGGDSLGANLARTVPSQIVTNSPNDVAGPASTNNDIVSSTMDDANNPFNLAIESALLNGNSGALNSLLGGQQKLNAATAAEKNLDQIYNQAGGAQGPLGGRLGILGSLFTGGESGSYNAQAQADAEAIAQATGQTPQAVQAELPKLTQDQSAAQASLGNIQSLIQALQGGGTAPSGLIGAVQ